MRTENFHDKYTQYNKPFLKEVFEDKKTSISEVDVEELHKHISRNDAQTISDIVHDALTSMGIEHDGFSWDINVTVDQEK